MKKNIKKLANVLMVEDNPMDIKLTEILLEDNHVNLNLICLRDGEECIQYLSSSEFNNAKLPNLILLDLNLPMVDGREVLQFIKRNEHLKGIPVAVLSGSSAQEDIDDTDKLGASIYLVKPIDVSSLEQICSQVDSLQLVHCKDQHYLLVKPKGETVNGPTNNSA